MNDSIRPPHCILSKHNQNISYYEVRRKRRCAKSGYMSTTFMDLLSARAPQADICAASDGGAGAARPLGSRRLRANRRWRGWSSTSTLTRSHRISRNPASRPTFAAWSKARGSFRRQYKMKYGTSLDAGRCPDPTVMTRDDRMANGKAHPHAALLGRKEWRENAFEVRWGNSSPGVFDRHPHFICFT